MTIAWGNLVWQNHYVRTWNRVNLNYLVYQMNNSEIHPMITLQNAT